MKRPPAGMSEELRRFARRLANTPAGQRAMDMAAARRDAFIIAGPIDNNEQLYWSNNDGWVDRPSAGTFHDHSINDPIGAIRREPAAVRRRGMSADYYVLTEDGDKCSADAGDYWNLPDSEVMGSLVRANHSWRTITGHRVTAPRLLKENATMRDLRRLSRCLA